MSGSSATTPVKPGRADPNGGVEVQLEDLTRTYGAVKALDGLNLTLAPGELVALLGPSGCGKTTALRILAGLDDATSGRVLVAGKDLSKVSANKRDMGMVFQAYSLFPHMTTRQNVEFGLKLRKISAGERKKRAMHMLELVGLETQSERYAHQLSGGQQQRVALARALAFEPSVLLLDEPLSALDAALKGQILAYLERVVAEWHIPTLFVSHDIADVGRLSDQCVLIERGKVLWTGTWNESFGHALLTTATGGLSLQNVLRVWGLTPVGDHVEGRVGGQSLFLPMPAMLSDHVIVSFFPRDVTLARATVTGVSIRNQLEGTVRLVLPFPDRVYVAVDVGQFLWAEVTPEAARELKLASGSRVVCLIKSSALRVV